MKKIIVILLSFVGMTGYAQEIIFANYFDIPLNSAAGTEVTGRVHIERNKDVMHSPIPKGYRFAIENQDEDKIFEIATRYDLSGRIMGVLQVAKGKNSGNTETVRKLTLSLNNGKKNLQKFDIEIHIVHKTLWSELYDRYLPQALDNSRMYGRMKFTDTEIRKLISELEQNNGRFTGVKCYDATPSEYLAHLNEKQIKKIKKGEIRTIDYEWEEVAKMIGGLGYAYIKSPVYGKNGNPEERMRLRKAIMNAILTYTNAVPIEGNDIMIDGKPIGKCTGDGFAMLEKYRWIGLQIATHQWGITDPLILPSLLIMPDIIQESARGDSLSLKVHNALIRYNQLFFAEIESRQKIDDKEGRWGELRDTIHSSGAWSDANLGHRLRNLLAFPIIWGDYNRPATYVQYWYTDFYKNQPFEGFSFANGWSPHGVLSDISEWLTRLNVDAHYYGQSGFHPDGTVSHHTGHATDAALSAYGFGWLTVRNMGFELLQNTPYRIADSHYQFELDRLLYTYPKLFYKQQMDFLVSGRSYLSDMKKFVMRDYSDAIISLDKTRSTDTKLKNFSELNDISKRIADNKYECSGTNAFWIQEYLVHRRGENEKPFFASLKLKSRRTVGAEDFDKIRKSWHLGYGILNIKVNGDEYNNDVMANMDWHALPGLTEEWRTDPLPSEGGSQASLPGQNALAGVLADGQNGMAIYHHLPQETYSSSKALKSYYFIHDKIIGLGSHIQRFRPGQGEPICTFLEQSQQNGTITYCIDGKEKSISKQESISLQLPFDSPIWIHAQNKGYVIFPKQQQNLLLKTGTQINVTDKKISTGKPNFIIALTHGVDPVREQNDGFAYVIVPNTTANEMKDIVSRIQKEVKFTCTTDSVHTVYSPVEKMYQYAFFAPGTAEAGGIRVQSETPATFMLQQMENNWRLSINNPIPDSKLQQMKFSISEILPAGSYNYQINGIYPIQGEKVVITNKNGKSEITVELPDERDKKQYRNQVELYAAAPIVIEIKK